MFISNFDIYLKSETQIVGSSRIDPALVIQTAVKAIQAIRARSCIEDSGMRSRAISRDSPYVLIHASLQRIYRYV